MVDQNPIKDKQALDFLANYGGIHIISDDLKFPPLNIEGVFRKNN